MGKLLQDVQLSLRGLRSRPGFALVAEESFGDGYARTLQHWRARFIEAWPEIQALGFDLRFKRMWDYYLAYCEAGFVTKAIDVGLYKLAQGSANLNKRAARAVDRGYDPAP